MPAPSTCGRQTRGRGRGRGEARRSCVGQTPTLTRHRAPRPSPDKDTPSRCTTMPVTLVSRIVLNLISQQCPIERECPSPGPSDGTSLGQTSSRKNVMRALFICYWLRGYELCFQNLQWHKLFLLQNNDFLPWLYYSFIKYNNPIVSLDYQFIFFIKMLYITKNIVILKLVRRI